MGRSTCTCTCIFTFEACKSVSTCMDVLAELREGVSNTALSHMTLLAVELFHVAAIVYTMYNHPSCTLRTLHVLLWLFLIFSEYNDWIMMKLQKMAGMVRQAEELVSQKVIFVEGFPLAKLFDNNASELLKEADILVASQVIVEKKCYLLPVLCLLGGNSTIHLLFPMSSMQLCCSVLSSRPLFKRMVLVLCHVHTCT